MMGRLIHYSREPLTAVRPRAHEEELGTYAKTEGLWVSVEGEDDWVAWCKSEQFNLGNFRHATEIILKPDSNVLRLTTAAQIDRFSHEFKTQLRPLWRSGIDWPAVRRKAQGLIIAPYCWERRLAEHTGWYYGWDCASGVIWDADAIAELRAVEPPDMKMQEEAA